MPVDPSTIANLPLFSGLSSRELEEMASQLDTEQLKAGATIIQEGDPPNHPLCVLLEGSVEVVKGGLDGHLHLISSLTAPSVFGEIEALSKKPAIASIRTITTVSVAYLRRGVFDEMCAKNSPGALKLVKNLAHVLSNRLAATDERLAATFDVGDAAAREKITQVRKILYSYESQENL